MDELKTIKRNMWMFPLGTVGRDMMYNLVTNFLLTYILFTKGLLILSSPGGLYLHFLAFERIPAALQHLCARLSENTQPVL